MSQQPSKSNGDGFVVTHNGQRVGATVQTQESADKKAATVRQSLKESPGKGDVVVKRQING